MAACHSGSLCGTVSFTALGSIPANQQRNQLSVAYCTTFKNGGDVTTRDTELAASFGLASAGPIMSSACFEELARIALVASSTSPNNCRVFLRMIRTTSRSGGIWFRFSLILRCDLAETAW